MKIGCGAYYLNRYGLKAGARKMREDGYEFVDYQLAVTEGELYAARDEDFLAMVSSVRRELNSEGISVSQIHGPWRCPPRDLEDADRAERFEKMTKAMVIGKYLGAKYMAIHPLMPFGVENDRAEEVLQINHAFFSALAKVASSLGIVICLENMPFVNFPLSDVKSIVDFVKQIDHPSLKMCFDTGHANMFEGRIGDMVRYAGDLIKIVHVHDNYGDADSHNKPYDGTVDWADFAEALFDVGFDGVMNLEANFFKRGELKRGISDERAAEVEKEMAKLAMLLGG